MRSSSFWYLIIYDIRNPRRLRRVQRHLKNCAYPVQESVFVWCGTVLELESLRADLRQRIDVRSDDVRGYRLRAHGVLHCWGVMPFLEGVYDFGGPPYCCHGLGKQIDPFEQQAVTGTGFNGVPQSILGHNNAFGVDGLEC